MRRWVVTTVLVVVVGAALLTAVPGSLGLAARTPLAQLVPFRAALALGLLAVAALSGGSALLSRRSSQSHSAPHRPVVRLGAAAGLLVAVLAHVGVLAVRGLDDSAPAPRQDGDLVVLSLNTEIGATSAREVAAAVGSSGADVVTLPETPASTAEEVADMVAAARGRSFQVLTATTGQTPNRATSLLLADDLGQARPAPAPDVGLAAVAATSADLPGPVVAAHPIAPVPGTDADMMQRWRQDLPRVTAACADSPGAVVAGDFNATLDHPGLRDLGPCVDAAAQAGAGGLGTWPSTVPALLAAPIDHVLVDGRTWRVESAEVVTVGASDHRGLVVHLTRRG